MSESEQSPSAVHDAAVNDADNRGAQEADRFFEFLRQRTEVHRASGMTEGRARDTAMLEHRMSQWPAEWGNELRILIYGDFRAPEADLAFPDLGIVVEAGAVTGSIISSAMCVLKSRVVVSERSIAALVEAGGRIELLLGILVAIDWGNAGAGWWCHVTHGSMAGGMPELVQGAIEKAAKAVRDLPPEALRQVTSALYWMREPRQMMREGYRSDVLRVYAGYWNAFECLVEAVCVFRPQQKLSQSEKENKLDEFLAARGGKLSPADVAECYRTIVDPGFVGKASHALRQCFPERAEGYIDECFRRKPNEDRLYNIRNAINHGDIDAGNLNELIRVDDRHRRLWMIVFGMLGQIIPVPRPLDAG